MTPGEPTTPLSSVEEVLAVVLDGRTPKRPRRVSLAQARGHVLAAPVIAREPIPPFANSAMDGFALRSVDTSPGPSELAIVGSTMAGEAAGTLGPGEAVRIMTGAPVPAGADSVVPIEDTTVIEPGRLELEDPIRLGANVRRAGEDVEVGDIVLAAQTLLGPAQLSLLAGLGEMRVLVFPTPRVGVISTGDELVGDGGPLLPGQIRDANRPALLAAIRASGFRAVDLGFVGDENATLAAALDAALGRVDAIVSSGGVSVGDRDPMKPVLAQLAGSRAHAFEVAIRPARPFAFADVNGAPVFGLPGNPSAAMISYALFVEPALRAMAGYPDARRPRFLARLDEDIRRRKDGKVHYVRVVVEVGADQHLHARSAGPQNPHLLLTGTRSNGLAILPDGEGPAAGDDVEILITAWDQVRAVGTPPAG